MFNIIFFSQQCHKYNTHHCLFSLTSPANAHIVHWPDPWPVPEKLFLPLAQTTAQLSSNPSLPPVSPLPFIFPLLLNGLFGVKSQRTVFRTPHGARLALCERDEEQPLVATFKFAHWVAGSDKHGSPLYVQKQSRWHRPWSWGDCPPPGRRSGSANFHPWLYDAIPPHWPAIGKHTRAGGLAERPAGWTPACCTVTRCYGVLVGSWKDKAKGDQILVVAEYLFFPKRSQLYGADCSWM